MRRFNRADQVLLLAALLFAACLALKLSYPGALWARALFFVSEAALVGGIADWFAVTALFKRPLGFPYHTALLPRQREKFAAACTKMVQDEFFAKKKLLLQIKKMNVLAMLLDWVGRRQGKTRLAAFMIGFMEELLDRIDKKALAGIAEKEILRMCGKARQESFYQLLARWNARGEWDERLLDKALLAGKNKLLDPGTKDQIEDFLRSYMAERTPGILGGLLSVLAEVTNVINFSEAAQILQRQLLSLCGEMMDRDDPFRRRFMGQVREKAAGLAEKEEWRTFAECVKNDVASRLLLSDAAEKWIGAFLPLLKRQESAAAEEKAAVVISPLADIVIEGIEALYTALQKDAALRAEIEDFVSGLFCRGALEAQSMIGVVVSEALASLSDEELNRLVYDKVEQDMIWLRVNGSIVGAVIGGVIFAVLELAGGMK